MEKMSRREFARDALGSMLTFSLLNILSDSSALAGSIAPVVNGWVAEMSQITREMRSGTITQKQWQLSIEGLLAKVDVNEVLRAIDYDRLVKRVVFDSVHETALYFDISKSSGVGGELGFYAYFYAMKKGVDIVPHAHKNLATMHMVVSGQAQAIHYEKVAEDSDFVIIKPASDVVARPGDASTISDEGPMCTGSRP